MVPRIIEIDKFWRRKEEKRMDVRGCSWKRTGEYILDLSREVAVEIHALGQAQDHCATEEVL